MAEVQSELKSLKQQVVLAEAALNDDTSVAQLETEVKWFSDEVTRLRTHAMSMKKDMNHIVSRCGVLNEQREFLNDQLKQVLKRSRVLEHEIGLASTYINEAAQSYQPDLQQHGNNDMEYENPAGIDEWDVNPDENDDYQLQQQYPDSADEKGREPSQSRGRRRHSVVGPRDALLQHGGSSSPTRERQQALYRGTSISQLDELFASRCPEEIIFERELEHIFKRMIARKQNEQNRTSLSTARSSGISGQPLELQDDKEEEDLAQRARRMGGVTGLGLEHFSDTDRFTAICNFLDNQTMFEKVVQVLATQYVNMTTK